MIKSKPRRWNIMPKYNPYEWSDYSVSVSPMGWRKLFHYPRNILEIPYFAGDKIKLRLTIRQKQENVASSHLQVYEIFPEYKGEASQIYNDDIGTIGLKSSKQIKIISEDCVAITGDGCYQIVVSLEESPNLNKSFPQVAQIIGFRQTIMTFHAYESAKVAFAIYSFLFMLFGGVISWFLKSWLTCG